MKEMHWQKFEKLENNTVTVHDKGSQFAVLKKIAMYIKLKIKLTGVLFYNCMTIQHKNLILKLKNGEKIGLK